MGRISLVLLPVLALSPALAPGSARAVSGEYVEVRSNHVYTCGCLYSGEQVTGGREAILAWAVREGVYGGADLTGARAVAIITGPESLSLEGTPRRSVMFVDGVAGPARRALVDMLKEHYGNVLGELLSVQDAPITLAREGERVRIEVAGLSRIVVRPAELTADAHQGSWLWYAPFIPTADAVLSATELWSFRGTQFGRQWREADTGITGYIATFRLLR
ncbi:MAG: DUF1326 domain-containing protein [Bryobacteraceae bacterium]